MKVKIANNYPETQNIFPSSVIQRSELGPSMFLIFTSYSPNDIKLFVEDVKLLV